MPCIDATAAAELPEVRRILAFRKILVHGYDVVDHGVVWDVITGNLPVLLDRVRDLLAAVE